MFHLGFFFVFFLPPPRRFRQLALMSLSVNKIDNKLIFQQKFKTSLIKLYLLRPDSNVIAFDDLTVNSIWTV